MTCGSNIETLRGIGSSFEDKVDVFTYGQSGWGVPKEIEKKFNNLVDHLNWWEQPQWGTKKEIEEKIKNLAGKITW